MHNDIQEVCRSSRLATALVLNFAGVQWVTDTRVW